MQIACGIKITPIPFRKTLRQNKKVSLVLKPFLPLLQGSENEVRCALTVLRLAYIRRCPPTIDLRPIVDPPKKNWSKIKLQDFTSWLLFAKRNSKESPKQVKSILRGKYLGGLPKSMPRAVSGPNGSSSLFSAHYDAVAIQGSDLHHSLKEFVRLSNCPTDLLESIDELANWAKENTPVNQKPRFTSRLTGISEKGCKTRTIAIGDYYSQCYLWPLHQFLMKKLERLGINDGTYSQERVKEFSKLLTTSYESYSFDLKSATDRFPRSLQKIVLSIMINGDFAQAWEDVMVNSREFSVSSSSAIVKYGTGQPMGLYSSWAVFALTHHIIVHYAAHLSGLKSFDKYCIVGDDVVICNKQVATQYRKLITQLGVDIDFHKSLISPRVPSSSEICKSLFRNGRTLTPIPPDLMLQCIRDVNLVTQLKHWIGIEYAIPSDHLDLWASFRFIYSHRRNQKKALILLTDPTFFKTGETQLLKPSEDIIPNQDINAWEGIPVEEILRV
nr:MAG: RNA-dependent RNA polymerase [Mitovirus sp.]